MIKYYTPKGDFIRGLSQCNVVTRSGEACNYMSTGSSGDLQFCGVHWRALRITFKDGKQGDTAVRVPFC